MLATFEGHKGIYNIKNNLFTFYGIDFINIFQVISFVKHLDSGAHYEVWNCKGLYEMLTGRVFFNGKWFPNEKSAKKFMNSYK